MPLRCHARRLGICNLNSLAVALEVVCRMACSSRWAGPKHVVHAAAPGWQQLPLSTCEQWLTGSLSNPSCADRNLPVLLWPGGRREQMADSDFWGGAAPSRALALVPQQQPQPSSISQASLGISAPSPQVACRCLCLPPLPPLPAYGAPLLEFRRPSRFHLGSRDHSAACLGRQGASAAPHDQP